MSWVVLGAPLDSSGSGRGEERAPEALRRAGLLERLAAEDAGDVTGLLRPADRDTQTGIIAADALRAASIALRDAVADVLRRGRRPFVVGGDCSVLLGAMAGAKAYAGALALWFVDGHPDFLDGASSPTGEAADMDLAILCGTGPEQLTELAGPPPLVVSRDVTLLGHRPGSLNPETLDEVSRVPVDIEQITALGIATNGARAVGDAVAGGLRRRRAWLHVDLDALDQEALPAVTYRQPLGLDWPDFEGLLTPLLASPAVVGVTLADFNADHDPDGLWAKRLVDVLGRLAHDSRGR